MATVPRQVLRLADLLLSDRQKPEKRGADGRLMVAGVDPGGQGSNSAWGWLIDWLVAQLAWEPGQMVCVY